MESTAGSEIAVARSAKDGCCTYCHRRFGDQVYWRGRGIFLGEETDHVIPRVLGGRIIVPCCSLCNRIKGAKRFDSLSEIQDFVLEKLVRGRSMVISAAKIILTERVIMTEELGPNEILEWVTLVGNEETAPRPTKRQISDRTRKLERHVAPVGYHQRRRYGATEIDWRDEKGQPIPELFVSRRKKQTSSPVAPESFSIDSLPLPQK